MRFKDTATKITGGRARDRESERRRHFWHRQPATRFARIHSRPSWIPSRFTQIRFRFARIRSRFTQIRFRFAWIRPRFAQIDFRFAWIPFRFEWIRSRFARIQSRFEWIRSRFAWIPSRFARIRLNRIRGRAPPAGSAAPCPSLVQSIKNKQDKGR
jgi:hypothetical protein